MGVSVNGCTPVHHPFSMGIFPYKPSSEWGTPIDGTPPFGTHPTQPCTVQQQDVHDEESAGFGHGLWVHPSSSSWVTRVSPVITSDSYGQSRFFIGKSM